MNGSGSWEAGKESGEQAGRMAATTAGGSRSGGEQEALLERERQGGARRQARPWHASLMQLLDFAPVYGRCKLGRVGLGFGENLKSPTVSSLWQVVVARAKREGWPEIGGLLCLCGSGSHGPPLEGGAHTHTHTRARPPWNSPGPWLAWLDCPNRLVAADGEIGCKCLEHSRAKRTSPAARLTGKRSYSMNMV